MHPGHKQALHKRARSHHNVFRCHVDVATLAPLCLLSLTACMSISIIAGLVQRAGHNDWNDGHDCGIPRLCLVWSGLAIAACVRVVFWAVKRVKETFR